MTQDELISPSGSGTVRQRNDCSWLSRTERTTPLWFFGGRRRLAGRSAPVTSHRPRSVRKPWSTAIV
jgi:hypothetical protein